MSIIDLKSNIMKRKKIIKTLKQISKGENDSLEKEISLGAINNCDPIDFLLDSYQDTSLIYAIDECFFDMHYDEIEGLCIAYVRQYNEQVDIGILSLKIALSWFAYQKVLEELLNRFGLMKKLNSN